MNDESTAVVEQPAEATAEATPQAQKRSSATPAEFAAAWNAASSRQEVVENLKAAGHTLTYGAVVARAKSYKAQGVALKDIPAAQRGRKINVTALNAEIAEQAAAQEAAE